MTPTTSSLSTNSGAHRSMRTAQSPEILRYGQLIHNKGVGEEGAGGLGLAYAHWGVLAKGDLLCSTGNSTRYSVTIYVAREWIRVMCDWITLLCSRNYHNLVKQLDFSKLKKKKKETTKEPRIYHGERTVSFNKWCWESWVALTQKNEGEPPSQTTHETLTQEFTHEAWNHNIPWRKQAESSLTSVSVIIFWILIPKQKNEQVGLQH